MSAFTQRKPDYKSAWIFPVLGFIAALTYALLIFPNGFAPAGVGGIATMVQYVFKFNAGYLNLLINVPILIAAWFLVDREFVLKSGLFTLSFSGFLMAFQSLDPEKLQRFQYTSTNGNSCSGCRGARHPLWHHASQAWMHGRHRRGVLLHQALSSGIQCYLDRLCAERHHRHSVLLCLRLPV